jgi:hypothetical protein
LEPKTGIPNQGVNERSIHVDNVAACFEQDCMHNLCSSAFVVVGAGSKIGHFIDIVGKWIHVMWILFASRVMGVQGRLGLSSWRC